MAHYGKAGAEEFSVKMLSNIEGVLHAEISATGLSKRLELTANYKA